MSIYEDGWLVGGGHKPFDYSGKLSYIDSSHTEILRVGSVDTNRTESRRINSFVVMLISCSNVYINICYVNLVFYML